MKRAVAAPIVLLTTLLVGITVPAQPKQQAPLTIVDLGVLPGAKFSEARSINNLGQIVGKSGDESAIRAFLWQNVVMTDLGTLGGASSDAFDINDRGQVVGTAQTASGPMHAFLWQNGQMIDLDPAGVLDSLALQINNEGQVVGGINLQPMLWQDGEVIEVPLDGVGAINDRGDIAGVLGAPHQWRAAIWRRQDRIVEFESFEGVVGVASVNAINRRGQLAGTVTLTDTSVRAFVSAGRRLVDLGVLPGGSFSFGAGINRFGQVVGEASVPMSIARHAVLWTHQGTIVDLGTLPDEGATCSFPPCLYSSARVINDAGQIVGFSQNADGQFRAVLWTHSPNVHDSHEPPKHSGQSPAQADGSR